ICAIGRTHSNLDNTSDALQRPEMWVPNLQDNLLGPVGLSILCAQLGLFTCYIGTGCIFSSNDHNKLYGEQSHPDFYENYYSLVKAMTDQLVSLLPDMVLNVRIRMPIFDDDHPRD